MRAPLTVLVLLGSMFPAPASETPTRQEAQRAMRAAAGFFHSQVANHGGYVWQYSADLEHRQGEGVADCDTIWIQPPGTPAVGEAMLDAWHATGDRFYLQAARDAADALVQGQLVSGGWYYHVVFDPGARRRFRYRVDRTEETSPDEPPPDGVGGWTVWKQRENKDNVTIMDDDVTPSVVRFLIRLDQALAGRDGAIHEAAGFALRSMMAAQYPNGAWSHNYDRFPRRPPDPDYYPVRKAARPESWSRTWTKDFRGCYMLNDRITQNAIATLLLAWQQYGQERYREAAERGGRFLLLAQMPAPQPAWAQQYDRHMHPVWDRKFEPPAISGLESQDVLETLLLLYRETGDRAWLEPLPAALDYLRKSRLPDGRLARFYELETNKPLYFKRSGKRYELTYLTTDRLPEHYAFIVDSRLDAIAAEHERLRRLDPSQLAREESPRVTPQLSAAVRAIIDALDPRGAWTEPGVVRDREGRKVTPPGGIIQSATFIDNMRTLARFVRATGTSEPPP